MRLYCTSASFYNLGRPVVAPDGKPDCLVEFPPTTEIRVNGQTLTANTRGLKKKPGTAPPPDLGKLLKQVGINTVHVFYMNNQQPFVSKVGFYLILSVLSDLN